MNEVVNINELNERIERESLFVDTLSREVSSGTGIFFGGTWPFSWRIL